MTLALARLESRHLERPQTRAFDVITMLADFAILTWAVEPAALARHLAPGFEPDIRTLDDGRQQLLDLACALALRPGSPPQLSS